MSLTSLTKKLLSNFTFFILVGIIFGFITDGYPQEHLGTISTILLIIAMTLSLRTIAIININIKKEFKNFVLSFLLCYGLLSIVTLFIGFFFNQIEIQNGFVAVAAAPPAIIIIPITKMIKGNIKLSLVSLSSLYIISIIFTPVIILIFTQISIPLWEIIKSIVFYIIIPLILSRIVRKIPIPQETSTIIINLCFLFLIIGMIGGNKQFIFSNLNLLPTLSLALLLRTIGTGSFALWFTKKIRVPRENQIPLALFASVKNEGLAILLALSLFCCAATLPGVLSIVFELMWIGILSFKMKKTRV